jgi:hypothetical protein
VRIRSKTQDQNARPKRKRGRVTRPLLLPASAFLQAVPKSAGAFCQSEAQCLSSIMPLVPFCSFAEVTLAICKVLFELSAVAITVTDLP